VGSFLTIKKTFNSISCRSFKRRKTNPIDKIDRKITGEKIVNDTVASK